MRAKSNEKPYNRNFIDKTGPLISEYSTSKPNPNLNEKNKKYGNIQNSNLYTGNSKANCKILPLGLNQKDKGLTHRSRSPKIQNTFTKYAQILQKPKTEITDFSGSAMPLTERSASSLNIFNFNADSAKFSSLGGYNQNQGVEVPKSLNELNVRNEDNFYLSDLDIVDIALSMNENTKQNTYVNYETNNLTKKETKKVEKNPFEYNKGIQVNELKYTNNQNNQFSTNEGEFCPYCESLKAKNQTVSTYQPQLPLKENELTNIQTTTTTSTDILNDYFKNDYNFNTEQIQIPETTEMKPDLTNIIQNPSTYANYEFSQPSSNEVKQEFRNSSTQTESNDLFLNVSLKIDPYETTFQNVNLISRASNRGNINKLGEINQDFAILQSIDLSSRPDSQNQNPVIPDMIDTLNLEQSPFATVSKIEHSEQKTENLPQNEIILKSEPEYNYNYDNIPFEIKDNNPFEVQNTRIGNESSLSKKEANTQDSIRYSVIESSHDEAKDLENIYIIAEAEMLEQEKKSSQN